MARKIAISKSEILDELTALGTAPENALTIAELAEASGRSMSTVQRALVAYRKQGRLQVHRKTTIGLDGRAYPTPAYTVLPEKRK